MGMILTLPISSAALGIILNLSGLAAGAATVGCCCNMVGFAGSAWIIVCHVIICPTSPAVPIPDPVALLVICKIIVPTGPKMALDKIAGSQMTGFLTIFGTCSIDVH